MRRFIFSIIFICCYANDINAQLFLDTLASLGAMKPDTININKIINITWANRTVELDQCIFYSEKALAGSRKIGYALGEGRSLTNLGAMQSLKGNYPQALKLYFDALTIWNKIGYYRGEMMVKSNIADVHGMLKQYEKQNQFLQEALLIAQAHNDEEGLATVYSNLSIYYSSQGQFRKALDAAIMVSPLFKKTE